MLFDTVTLQEIRPDYVKVFYTIQSQKVKKVNDFNVPICTGCNLFDVVTWKRRQMMKELD